MFNLEGDIRSTQFVLSELVNAGIPTYVGMTQQNHLVPTKMYGELGGVVFRRGWNYWSATISETTKQNREVETAIVELVQSGQAVLLENGDIKIKSLTALAFLAHVLKPETISTQ